MRVPRDRETDMSLRNNEQRALDAIENQLRAEEPQLADCFSVLGSKSPRIKPLDGWDDQAAPVEEAAPRGRHRNRDREEGAIRTELVVLIIAVLLLVGVAIGVASWVRTR
jgi:hypothetical protein